MKEGAFLFDTHALLFWSTKESVSTKFIQFFDRQDHFGRIYVSPISFWEIALLAEKGRILISDVNIWKNELLSHTSIQIVSPSITDMIDSTLLVKHHRDPFDRLLVIQAVRNDLLLVTRDKNIQNYDVETFWM